MELYTLDGLLRREQVIDRFTSLIWTERYNSDGDLELSIRSTFDSRNALKPGTMLAMNESYRIMVIETVEDKLDDEGRAMLSCKGSSLESILKDRVCKQAMGDLDSDPNWKITAPANVIMSQIFRAFCVEGLLSALDVIPFVIEGTFMPPSNRPMPTDLISVDIPPTTVYDAIADIAEVSNLGFRLLRHFDTSKLYWDVYIGSDRSASQATHTPVIFTQELDNLTNVATLNSISGAKNVAYVFSPAGYLVVYPDGVEPDIDGFDRKVLMVNATDVTLENTPADQVTERLRQIGKTELSKNQAIQVLDGEINQNSQYKYQRDYYLGDIVEMRNSDGVLNQMTITEQIFVSDAQGERSYPTLKLNTFVNAGSWAAQPVTLEWIDFEDNPTTWSEQP